MSGVNELLEEELPEDWREVKFRNDLETLCAMYLKAGGDPQVGVAILAKTTSDVMAIAVLQQVQEDFGQVLTWLVTEVRKLKGESDDVPTDTEEQGEVAGERGSEDGQDGPVAVDSGGDREGR